MPHAEIARPIRSSGLEEIAKMHLQLGRCGENEPETTTRPAQMRAYPKLIQKLLGDCGRQAAVRRIAAPPISWRVSKYYGETVALDIVFPCTRCFGENISKEYHALFIIDSFPALSIARCGFQ